MSDTTEPPAPNIVKQPHYVWRFYLEPWEVDKSFTAYRDGRVFATRAKGVAKEGGFHRIIPLSNHDIALLKTLVVRPGSPSAKIHDHYINWMMSIHDACKPILDAPALYPKNKVLWANKLVNDAEEALQGGVEDMAMGWLKSLRLGDATFLDDPKVTMFGYYLGMQYFRTKEMMERMVEGIAVKNGLLTRSFIERAWRIMRHIYAVELGTSLYHDRAAYNVVFLRRGGNTSFIAGAQPIVNLHQTGDLTIAPKELELYYPLGPDTAMIYTNDPEAPAREILTLSDEEVDAFNRHIVAACPNYLFGKDAASLKPYVPAGTKGI